ncbi:hypothetical protein O181_004380 [Austropuccinia psidii MF-1]|uniref:Mediator of RNA polymerase II transcription subunit 14 n=1 Tax=Austropuccinia psidii MF-1 TaxID=1389203 RepID=A0A9Q3GET3_9BASI|nr:hypothetical protein [Austropuccinia psidii MF-1]
MVITLNLHQVNQSINSNPMKNSSQIIPNHSNHSNSMSPNHSSSINQKSNNLKSKFDKALTILDSSSNNFSFPISIDQLDPQTINQIDQLELGRQWGPHLVPLQFVIQRTIAQVFNELQMLAETSPTLDDFERKKRVIDYVIHSRRQIIKLLVLVKWSSNSSSVHKIMSIVEFLQRQNRQVERTVDILKASKQNFYSARMRNYDLPTALRVLTQGYPTLPGQLIEEFETKPKLTDSQVIKIMEDLNDLIRFRLAGFSNEVLPKEFRSYQICDGRVIFRVDHLFECSLTLGGGDSDSQWYLLHVEFLFKVAGPRGKDFSSTPQGLARDQIIELGNQIMAPTGQTTSNQNPKPPPRPLMKLFAFLRDLCLNYQMEALHYQASQLERSAWASHTRVTSESNILTILYWTHARPAPIAMTRLGQQASKVPSQPIPLGSLTISLKVETHSPSQTKVLDFLNGYPPIEKKSITDDGDYGASYKKRIQVIWHPIELAKRASRTPDQQTKLTRELLNGLMIQEGKELIFSQNETGLIELELVLEDLCLENILERAVRVHTDCIMRRAFYDLTRLEQPVGLARVESRARSAATSFASVRMIPCEVGNQTCSTRYGKSIEVVLHARHAVEVLIDQFSGRFRLQSITNQKSSTVEVDDHSIERDLNIWCQTEHNPEILKTSGDKINRNPSDMREILIQVKSNVLLNEIEFKAHRLGIRTTRNLPIRPQDLHLLSNSPSNSIFQRVCKLTTYCRLSNFKDHYLLIMITESGIQCLLILINTILGGSGGFWKFRRLERIVVPKFYGDSEANDGGLDPFTLSRAQLQYVYHHCLVQVTLNKLMIGLQNQRVSYQQLLPLTEQIISKHSKGNPVEMPILNQSFQVVGLLMIPVDRTFKKDILKEMICGRNMAIRVTLSRESYLGIQVELRMKYRAEKINSRELESVILLKQKMVERIKEFETEKKRGHDFTGMTTDPTQTQNENIPNQDEVREENENIELEWQIDEEMHEIIWMNTNFKKPEEIQLMIFKIFQIFDQNIQKRN